MPKNHKDWPHRFGDIATIPSKTWFFTNFTFLSFLTHPNDQKMFQRPRSQFFHLLKHQKKFHQNWGTLGPKVFGPAWIQSGDIRKWLSHLLSGSRPDTSQFWMEITSQIWWTTLLVLCALPLVLTNEMAAITELSFFEKINFLCFLNLKDLIRP